MQLKAIAVEAFAPEYFDESNPIDLADRTYSFWRNKRWRFRSPNPASRDIILDWCFSLPDGSFSTDAQHISLLEGFKTMTWGMITNELFGKSLHVHSLGPIMVGNRELFRWMVWTGRSCFSELTPSVQDDYISALQDILANRQSFYPGYEAEGYGLGFNTEEQTTDSITPEESEDDESLSAEDNDLAEPGQSSDLSEEAAEDDGYTYGQLSNRVRTLYFLHAQRSLLESRRIRAFHRRPFGDKTYGEVTAKVVPHVIRRIPALPELVAIPLLNTVVDWIENKGPILAAAHQSYHAACAHGDMRLKRKAINEICAAGFDDRSLSKVPWGERGDVQWQDVPDAHRVRLSALMFRDACVLALQYLVGLRISEVCSAKTERLKNKGLPSCIHKRETPDGLFDLYFFKGQIYKDNRIPFPRDWVIGAVPRGSKKLPVCAQAITHLHTIWSRLYEDEKENPLFMHFSNPHSMPRDADGVVAAKGTTLQRGIRRFVRCWVDLSSLPDFDVHGNDLRQYRSTRGQCIRGHQGRKTFAEYILQARESAAEALTSHYGHLNKVILFRGYFEPLQRQKSDVENMRLQATINYFVAGANGRSYFGNVASAVQAFYNEHGLTGIRDLETLRGKVKDIVVSHGIRIFFGAHGNCLISVRPTESRCREASGGASWWFQAPDYISQNVSMCTGCGCFAADSAHLPYWRNRMASYEAAAQDPTNRVAVIRFETSKIIVKAIERI
ncbi:hypothetical protein [Pelomonas sp. SE-A7]|uniref:hypothetical protein n=1 Tax=Pelomonas sp. SE-A7 TaxID=3054953 RepID=UPI00259CC5F0|nr:hypothetical protein [Pelomonas sp. SE-A7]MDM4765988.1 hypothetical protein [Pelomonas sp. SE-A7]